MGDGTKGLMVNCMAIIVITIRSLYDGIRWPDDVRPHLLRNVLIDWLQVLACKLSPLEQHAVGAAESKLDGVGDCTLPPPPPPPPPPLPLPLPG